MGRGYGPESGRRNCRSIRCAEDQCRAALFLNRGGGRLSARAVNQLLDDLAADADLEDAVSKLPADQ